MSNPPIKMIFQETANDTPKEVLVYDFLHDTTETFQSLALCWNEKNESWITLPVAFLRPVFKESASKKQKLNEKVNT